VAEVDGDARLLLRLLLLLLLEVARGTGDGVLAGAALGDVLAGLGEGGLGEGHDLVVRDGRVGVVAHDGSACGVRGLMLSLSAEKQRMRRW
jgi:hypothetical protein